MELKPEVNYLHGHEIADARARRMARDNATLVARLQQNMDTMQQAHTDFSASVNAALAEIPDIVNGMRHYVTPQDFGAVGDGIADDTDAMQAALDTGHDIYVPCMRREKYLITRTLNVTSFNQLIFADSDYLNWASTNVTTEGTDGGFVFRTTETNAPLFLITGGMVAFSNLNIICANRHKGIAIAYNKSEDQTNVDGSVIRCYIKNFETAISYSGRGLAVKDCFFYYNNTDVYCHMPADDAWKTDGSDTPTYQTHPNHAGRGYRMESNRHHLTQGTMYSFAGDTTEKDGVTYTYGVKGALITNNSCDLGIGYFIRFNCPVFDSIITNNHVNRCSAENVIQSSHPLTRVVIANNTVSGLIEGNLHYCPKNAIYVKAFDDCTINANVFTNIEGMCIATWYSGYTNHTTITANVFTNVGFDTSISSAANRAAIPMSDANGVTITGNVFNISAPFNGCAVSRMAVSAKTWTDVIVQDNVIPNANAILIPTGAAAVRVDVQGAEGSKGSELVDIIYSDTLTWDGSTVGRACYEPEEMGGGGWYKVSAAVLSASDFMQGGTVTTNIEGAMPISPESIMEPVPGIVMVDMFLLSIAPNAVGVDVDLGDGLNLNVPEPGLYLMRMLVEGVAAYISSVSIQGYQFKTSTIKSELLPEMGNVYPFVITMTSYTSNTESTWVCNRSLDDILTAARAGKTLIAQIHAPNTSEGGTFESFRSSSNVTAISIKPTTGEGSEGIVIVDYGTSNAEPGVYSPCVTGYWEFSPNGLTCKYFND